MIPWRAVSRDGVRFLECVNIILHTKGVLVLGVVYHTWGFGVNRLILA